MIGYGWTVDWLRDGEKAVILFRENYKNLLHFKSHLDYYEMKNRNNFNNEKTTQFASFPNNEQCGSEIYCENILFLATTSSSLYTHE
jgi:hypothetical protein